MDLETDTSRLESTSLPAMLLGLPGVRVFRDQQHWQRYALY